MIVTLVTRAFQLIFAAIVLGLSVSMTQWQAVGKAPATTGYAAFCGGWGLVAAAIGLIASFIEAIPALVIIAIDALSALIFLAGGIALTVAMKGLSCSSSLQNYPSLFDNKIVNGGCIEQDGERLCGTGGRPGDDEDDVQTRANSLKGRCQRGQADYVFLFLGMVMFLMAIGVTFFAKKRGSRKMVV
ncbi:hypothetical protein EJ05DRAFT_66086 [Pseudovirgaria hyperparasitica]|uniref:MARVEL domain-containing protein n=1 Tax=Pseudovirgaria hyperparasitica TaxID=470096 RepID=A0A6A6W3A3_9PEZI|nr:uncharacterized protein EJ05DRAFT_66086 [Pseudovirgaria hyperparasitica]KAF2756494.1 hypothetical protein EJ05DRAFT_66086 [Pseudovirgaria hyperparasitica]